MWLKEDGLSRHDDLRVSCFIINCLTVVSSAALVTVILCWKNSLNIVIFKILQCVAMNVTLIYAFLAYSSIKQRDFSGVYVSCYCLCVACYSLHKHFQFLCNCQIHLCLLHVSPDGAADTSVCPCMAPSLLFHYLLHCLVYFTLAQNANGQFSTLLRTLPIVLIVVPFGVIAEEYDLVRDANNCSCW